MGGQKEEKSATNKNSRCAASSGERCPLWTLLPTNWRYVASEW
jgi:hypothetical protein